MRGNIGRHELNTGASCISVFWHCLILDLHSDSATVRPPCPSLVLHSSDAHHYFVIGSIVHRIVQHPCHGPIGRTWHSLTSTATHAISQFFAKLEIHESVLFIVDLVCFRGVRHAISPRDTACVLHRLGLNAGLCALALQSTLFTTSSYMIQRCNWPAGI